VLHKLSRVKAKGADGFLSLSAPEYPFAGEDLFEDSRHCPKRNGAPTTPQQLALHINWQRQ
jgi:hypothetical protein